MADTLIDPDDHALEFASKQLDWLRTNWRIGVEWAQTEPLLNIIGLLIVHTDLLERKVARLEQGSSIIPK